MARHRRSRKSSKSRKHGRRAHRAHKSRGRRHGGVSRRMRRARKTQNRTRSRASTKGYKRLKARGRTKIKRSTFFKLRRRARNPNDMSRVLRDGTQVTLDRSGSGAILRVFDGHGELISEKSYGSLAKATQRFKKYSSGKKFAARQERDDWAMLAGDNPRRGRRGRGRGRRRNPAQFPTPFSSALMNPRRRRRGMRNPPISRSDAKAMARVLRRHGHKRCRI